MGTNKFNTEELTDGKMSLPHFEESFWVFIPEDLISTKDIDRNSDWSDMIVQEAWRMYVTSNIDHAFIFKMMQNMIYAYKRHNPKFE